MFITTLVPVGELASTPPSFTSASATVSVPMSIWNAAASLYVPAGWPSSVITVAKSVVPWK